MSDKVANLLGNGKILTVVNPQRKPSVYQAAKTAEIQCSSFSKMATSRGQSNLPLAATSPPAKSCLNHLNSELDRRTLFEDG